MEVLTPAYGRDYRTKEEVEEAYKSGVDMVRNLPVGQQYCSCRDFPNETVQIRFYQNRNLTTCMHTPKEAA